MRTLLNGISFLFTYEVTYTDIVGNSKKTARTNVIIAHSHMAADLEADKLIALWSSSNGEGTWIYRKLDVAYVGTAYSCTSSVV